METFKRLLVSIKIKLLNNINKDSLTPRLEGVIPIKCAKPETELYKPTLEILMNKSNDWKKRIITIIHNGLTSAYIAIQPNLHFIILGFVIVYIWLTAPNIC